MRFKMPLEELVGRYEVKTFRKLSSAKAKNTKSEKLGRKVRRPKAKEKGEKVNIQRVDGKSNLMLL